MWGLIIFADDIDTFVFEDDKNATFSVAVDGCLHKGDWWLSMWRQ